MADEQAGEQAGAPRQSVVRVAGSRRAQLTPVPGADASAETPAENPVAPVQRPPVVSRAQKAVASGTKGPNDDRMREDVPPHY